MPSRDALHELVDKLPEPRTQISPTPTWPYNSSRKRGRRSGRRRRERWMITYSTRSSMLWPF